MNANVHRPDVTGHLTIVSAGHDRTPPDTWRRLADLVPVAAGRSARRWITTNASHEGRWQRYSSDRGGPPEVWVAPELAASVSARFNAPDERRSSSDTTGHDRTPAPDAPSSAAEVWRMMLARADREADALRAELRAARDEALTAARRAEEAEAGRHAALARVDALRAAWWRWYATANGPWWSRLRGLPKPPAEVDEPPLLAAPRG